MVILEKLGKVGGGSIFDANLSSMKKTAILITNDSLKIGTSASTEVLFSYLNGGIEPFILR